MNNNGANFAVNLKSLNSTSVKVSLVLGCSLSKYFNFKHVYHPQLGVDGKYILKWLLDEIAEREKEAERSLMHR